MKDIIARLQKVFDHRARLGIMSILLVDDWVDFNTLKERLELTDGALAAHLKTLEDAAFLNIRKEFIGRKPRTSYQVTHQGRKAFNDHLDALEQLLRFRE